MPIPNFDHNNVLPPHLGNPTQRTHLSPYTCTILELCHKFSTSKERIEILKGLIDFRKKMTKNGIIHGFQWIDGSFIEDIEKIENRPPKDIDAVTFYGGIPQNVQINLNANFPEFISPTLSKNKYKVDHYAVDYTYNPNVTVEMTRYWLQLFTHNRNSIWKGILKLEINTPIDDEHAKNYLNSL
ncbi:DUF6932 family protein [Tenacibaculum sp. IB213877]|uniref:DUF6932 family protein n=1 Tax=Tenacibaculum sp. IB213877 TaxID=3097351 RepID=UPI002A5B0E95|nr:hypothetical protein [Tenacibaculum sp. IB213877]MDY0781274.1 hypothetical protein [Tenacibaculum sp. IB213877]